MTAITTALYVNTVSIILASAGATACWYGGKKIQAMVQVAYLLQIRHIRRGKKHTTEASMTSARYMQQQSETCR